MPALEPPRHLSDEARAYLLDSPDPPAVLDFGDPAVMAEARPALHQEWAGNNAGVPGPWVSRDDSIAGIPVVRFATDEQHLDGTRVIVHLHGGNYVLGSPMTNAVVVAPMAQRTGLPVISIDYRLAPEHRCPAAVDDAVAVMAELASNHELVALYGESAGGGLALATAVALRDGVGPVPARLGLISPWVDLTCSSDTYRTLLTIDPDFSDMALPLSCAMAYAGDDRADPRASPLFADLSGLPPTLIQVGGREILLGDSCRLARAMRAAGAEATLDIWDGLWHVWHLWPQVPESGQAFDELARFLTSGI